MREDYFRTGKCVKVLDGDTIDIQLDLGYTASVQVRIRLADIQAPERGETDHKEAGEYLAQLILNKKIGVLSKKFLYKDGQRRGSYRRWLGYIYLLHNDGSTVDGPNINERMINHGFAVVYAK